MAETKKPTGLSITRNGNKFITKWHQGGKDYDDGQQWQYAIGNGWTKYPGASDSNIGVKKTEKNINIALADYWPSGKKLTAFKFRVRGNQKKSGKENLGWSDWESKEYELKVPSTPDVKAETSNNKTKFSWTVTNDTNKNRPFRRVSVWTALKENYNDAPSKNTQWTLITTQSTHEGASISKSGYSSALGGFQATGYVEFTESSSKIAEGNWTRMVKIVAQGCAGDSVSYDYHVYGQAGQAVQTDGVVNQTSSGYAIKVSWDTAMDRSTPIDDTVIQWVIAEPNPDMSCPPGLSWTDGRTVYDTGDDESAVINIDTSVGYDQCLYTRVNTQHDGVTTYGAAILQVTGKLTPPGITVGTTSQSTATAQITITHNFAIDGSRVAIIYNNNGAETIVGLVSRADTFTVKCPAWSEGDTVTFGAKAVLPKTVSSSTDDGVTIYDVDAYMESDLIMQSGTVAQAPSNVVLAKSDDDVRVSWQNNWNDATGIELSWSENQWAWESTDQPDTFEIDNPYLTAWRIAGLETGKTWYIRVRAFVEGDSNAKAYSPFSPTVAINLSSSPSIPTLALSQGVVPVGANVTASWDYASTDGTPQDEARIYSYANDAYTLIATAQTQEYIDLKFSTAGAYQLCVEVISASGQSSGKSPLINLAVAEPLVCTVTNSLEDVTVTDDDEEERTVHALTQLPLTATVTGAGTGGTISLVITRAAAYYLERPDESNTDGFMGETILSYTQTGINEISIEYDDLIGSLDDGGLYTLTATVTDNIGQSASVSEDFEVLWSHQAIVPEGLVLMDSDNCAAMITPIAPEGTTATDVCDIYRLSADKPLLVYSGAVFGQKYVDPYPAMGENGGYRFVFRTADGDYTTADNTLAFYDCYDDTFSPVGTIINFAGETVVLRYDLDISHQWDKGFVSERFLDGSIKGYWNTGVERSGSVKTVSVPAAEEGIISSMRRLAEYTGRCHVRTPDGSSFAADVRVSESWGTVGKKVDFQLEITRTDSEPEGIEYADWMASL